MKREILDYLGNKIGELEFPEGTPEEVCQAKLAKYAAPPARVFPAITPRQVRLTLLGMGITPQMVHDAILAAISGPEQIAALIEWEYAISFERDAPFVDSVGQLLGLSPSQIDTLWEQAARV